MTRVNQPPPSEAIADFFNGIGAYQTYERCVLLKKTRGRHTERISESPQHSNGGISRASLKVAQVGTLHTGSKCQFFLR
jgi:hypothetical protein